jgi:hypothetical protein
LVVIEVFVFFSFCEVGGLAINHREKSISFETLYILAACNNLWCKYGKFNFSSSKYDDFVHFLTTKTKCWLYNWPFLALLFLGEKSSGPGLELLTKKKNRILFWLIQVLGNIFKKKISLILGWGQLSFLPVLRTGPRSKPWGESNKG